jgi:hypothetical protein
VASLFGVSPHIWLMCPLIVTNGSEINLVMPCVLRARHHNIPQRVRACVSYFLDNGDCCTFSLVPLVAT